MQSAITFKRLRTRLKMTYKQLSAISGYSEGFLCKLENGNRNMRPHVAMKFAEIAKRNGIDIVFEDFYKKRK